MIFAHPGLIDAHCLKAQAPPVKEALDLNVFSERLKPHRAVCCKVLNLPSQVGPLPQAFALAEAYRIHLITRDPFRNCWLKTGLRHHEHSRALILYHRRIPVRRLAGLIKLSSRLCNISAAVLSAGLRRFNRHHFDMQFLELPGLHR